MTIAAGSCIPLGGAIARFTRIQSNWLEDEFRHFIIALGGGVLLGAVVVVLIPAGMEQMAHSFTAILVFLSGGFIFFLLEPYLGLHKKESPQIAGMLLDFIPESMALGGLLALHSPSVLLLALLIGLQNIPEGFNAYHELAPKDKKSDHTLLFMCLLVLLGPIAGVIGFYYLSDHDEILGAIMLFSSGGILYLIFQDIAPQSKLNKHWLPPLGAVVGVSITLFGQLLLL